jgi:arylsulfatase
MNPLTKLRVPLICDPKSDPYEYSVDASAYYLGWLGEHAFLIVPSVQVVGAYLKTYKDFPPRQRPATFSIDQVIEQLEAGMKGK